MKIILNESESEEYFYHALCNGLGWLCNGNGLLFDYIDKEYDNAKEKLLREMKEKHGEGSYAVCFEDILMEILRSGGKLTIVDEEGGRVKSSRSIELKDVHERVQNTQTSHLMDMIEDRDDAITADVILQSVFFEDIIFG
tara:strand:+ start:1365 stop:1784 length:420 start_codon:yes stop_codon:yes gene_type:complete